MSKKKYFNIIAGLIASGTSPTYSQSIKTIDFDLSSPYVLKLHPEKIALIDFPCPILKISNSHLNEIGLKVAKSRNNELDIWLNNSKPQVSNFIVRCKDHDFIFDVRPNYQNYTLHLKINGIRPSKRKTEIFPIEVDGAKNSVLEYLNSKNKELKFSLFKGSIQEFIKQKSTSQVEKKILYHELSKEEK